MSKLEIFVCAKDGVGGEELFMRKYLPDQNKAGCAIRGCDSQGRLNVVARFMLSGLLRRVECKVCFGCYSRFMKTSRDVLY